MIYVIAYILLASLTGGLYLGMSQYKPVSNGKETSGIIAASILWPVFLPLAVGAMLVFTVSRGRR